MRKKSKSYIPPIFFTLGFLLIAFIVIYGENKHRQRPEVIAKTYNSISEDETTLREIESSVYCNGKNLLFYRFSTSPYEGQGRGLQGTLEKRMRQITSILQNFERKRPERRIVGYAQVSNNRHLIPQGIIVLHQAKNTALVSGKTGVATILLSKNPNEGAAGGGIQESLEKRTSEIMSFLSNWITKNPKKKIVNFSLFTANRNGIPQGITILYQQAS